MRVKVRLRWRDVIVSFHLTPLVNDVTTVTAHVTETECPSGSPPEAVLIDSLLCVDQYRGADKAASSNSDEKPARDIAEVAAATELILPKGSFRTTSPVRWADAYTHGKKSFLLSFLLTHLIYSFTQTCSQAPFLLHGTLREYQQIGVDWLVNLHKKHLNGILADETGLGKTVQTVAYMAHLAGQEGTVLLRDTSSFSHWWSSAFSK